MWLAESCAKYVKIFFIRFRSILVSRFLAERVQNFLKFENEWGNRIGGQLRTKTRFMLELG